MTIIANTVITAFMVITAIMPIRANLTINVTIAITTNEGKLIDVAAITVLMGICSHCRH